MVSLSPEIFIVGSGQLGLSHPADCHVWAIRGPGGIVVVDAGTGLATEQVVANIKSLGLSVEGVLLTHYHFDHACGAPILARALDCPVMIAEFGAQVIRTQDRQASGLQLAIDKGMYPPETPWENYEPDGALADGEVLELAGLEIQCLLIQSHSEDSMCFITHIGGRKCIFVGDVIRFGGTLGLINWRGSTLEGYRQNLPKLAGLEIDILLPGHGLPTLANGQHHIDLAIKALEGPFVPWCVNQSGYWR